MNVYSELWALLRPEKSLDGGGALFGTLALLPCEEGFLLLFFVE